MSTIEVGAVDAQGIPVSTKRTLAQMLAHNVQGVRFFAVSLAQAGKAVWFAHELDPDTTLVVLGPVPYATAAWRAEVRRDADGNVTVS